MNKSTNPGSSQNEHFKLRRDKKKSMGFAYILLTILGVFSPLMLGISLSILSPETGPLANFKILLVTCSAGLVTYGVNRLGIERGAPAAAIGYHWTGIISVIAILLAGSGMFIGAHSGLIYKSVEERVLIDNGAALNAYIRQIDQSTLIIKRADPALRLVADDLASYTLCEQRRSCLSQNGQGGFGPVALETKKRSTRADGIANAFEKGDVEYKRLLKDINRLNRRYQEKLTETDKSLAERRATLQGIHNEITQATMALSEAVPVSLFRTYTQELLAGVNIPRQRIGTDNLNAILRQHGETLSNILDEIEENTAVAPAFPTPPGMLDTLYYITDFFAFAAVIFIAELILPITLWALSYQSKEWDVQQRLDARRREEEVRHSNKRGRRSRQRALPQSKGQA